MLIRNKHNAEIAAEARKLILQEGKTRQEAFELLADKYKYTGDVAEEIKYIPSAPALAKYGKWNTLLLLLLIGSAAYYLILAPSAAILWSVVLIIGVASKNIRYYFWISIMSVLSLLAILIMIATEVVKVQADAATITMIVLLIPCCIIPAWLENKLCPKPTVHKEYYTNSEGEQRMKVVYAFRDLP